MRVAVAHPFSMAKAKPALVRLRELAPGQSGDFFAFLAERNVGATRDGKPFFTCRFRDTGRIVTAMIWADSPWYPACAKDWREGDFFKLRGQYLEHPTYGPQIDIHNIRAVVDDDKADGFEPLDYVERSRFDAEAMFQELWSLAETHIVDVPLRRLVLTLLEKNAKQLKRVPATTRHFFPFAAGLLEHTLSVTHSCIHLADKYAAHYDELDPPLEVGLTDMLMPVRVSSAVTGESPTLVPSEYIDAIRCEGEPEASTVSACPAGKTPNCG